MFVYSVADQKSFDGLKGWYEWAENYVPSDTVRVLVGTQTDLERVIEWQKAKDWASERGMRYFEVSAKTGQGVNKLFEYCVEKMYFKFQHRRRKSSKEIRLEKKVVPKRENQGCC